VTAPQDWIFDLCFNCKNEEGRLWAANKREESLAFLRKTVERMPCFSVIAKDENKTCLLLHGCMSLKNPCKRDRAKRLLAQSLHDSQKCTNSQNPTRTCCGVKNTFTQGGLETKTIHPSWKLFVN